MVGKATVITHGSNAVRYSADKEKAEIVKVNHLPDNISSSAMWTRMMALQQKYREKLSRHRPFKNTSIRIELSPAKEETEGWTMAEWEELADEYIREFDAIDLSEKAKRESARHTNLQNSQYVVSLHHDSKGQILHLHINANRIDMEGNVNDAHFIHDRAMMAANKITERRGWMQAETKRKQNICQITDDCTSILKGMDFFDWNVYEARLKDKGYGVMLKRDSQGKVVGYSVKKGNSTYKSSDIGHSRNLTPSRIGRTWLRLHVEQYPEKAQHTQFVNPIGTRSSAPKPARPVQPNRQQAAGSITTPKAIKVEKAMCHHDIEVEGKRYSFDIPQEVESLLLKETAMPDDALWSTLEDVQHTAMLLFMNYLDAATTLSDSCGGGGGGSDTSGWGRNDNEDDMEWARRCARMASRMHRRPSRGIGR